MADAEMKKRGLIHHAVGHGWTCEPFGISGLGWEEQEYTLSPQVTCSLALVNGKREIWKGVALNTNLCYSNPHIVSDFLPVMKRNLNLTDACQAKSWYYLQIHGEICTLLSRVLSAMVRGEQGDAWNTWLAIKEMVQRREVDIQPVLDVFLFISTVERRLFPVV